MKGSEKEYIHTGPESTELFNMLAISSVIMSEWHWMYNYVDCPVHACIVVTTSGNCTIENAAVPMGSPHQTYI